MIDALAQIRADLAEYLEISSVCHDAIESYAPPDQVTELMRQANDVADRIIGATIAGMAPSGEPAERLYLDDEPRPGSWFGDTGADGRMLTQRETDLLVRAELLHVSLVSTEWKDVLGTGLRIRLQGDNETVGAGQQRGGIDSDPLVRLLAFRVWRDRDRSWFEDHGVRNGEAIVLTEPIAVLPHDRGAVLTIGRSWQERPIGHALEDGRPGQMIKARIETDALRPSPIAGPGFTVLTRGIIEVICRVSDRPRQQPDWFRPGDENPLSSSAWTNATSDQILYDIRSLIADPNLRGSVETERMIDGVCAMGFNRREVLRDMDTLMRRQAAPRAVEQLRRYVEERTRPAIEKRVYNKQYNQATPPPNQTRPPMPRWARERRKR